MPTTMHQCVGAWISKVLLSASWDGLLTRAWNDTIDIMGATGRLLIGFILINSR